MARPRKESPIGEASQVEEGAITQTRSDRMQNITGAYPKPIHRRYVVKREMWKAGSESVKVVQEDTIEKVGVFRKMVLRLKTVKGKFVPAVGSITPEMRKVLADQGIKV